MVFKFNDWLEIDKTEEHILEYMENYADHYEEAFNKIYKSNLKRDKLVVKMVIYLKSRGVGKKLALPFMAYDVDTWLENKKNI